MQMRNFVKMLFQTLFSVLKTTFAKGYLNNVAVLTVALSVFIVATFLLFLINANQLAAEWKKGLQVMAYLETGTRPDQIDGLKKSIEGISGVAQVTFISKAEGLAYLKERLKGQLALFEDLKENPLPDAFEVRLSSKNLNLDSITAITKKIDKLEAVESVEFGQAWLHRFTNIFNLFQFATFGIAGLFFMASVFIIGNTIRLMLYAKRDEIDIMRLVGASESFIKKPYYIEGLVVGMSGGVLGLLAVYAGYLVVSSNMVQTDAAQIIRIHFFSWGAGLGIICCSLFVGWLGCAISLKQYFKS